MHQEKFSLGLTGGIGSGKTTIANAFQAQGASL
ncbi:dephospho-CoA kinase, partial [Undibacterium luofuense]